MKASPHHADVLKSCGDYEVRQAKGGIQEKIRKTKKGGGGREGTGKMDTRKF